jgi:phosphatidate cytidylyltransferase
MGRLHCTPDPIYSPNTYTLQAVAELLPPALLDVAAAVAAQLPAGLRHWLAGLAVTMRPMELHAMVLAVFASFVAPFGESSHQSVLGGDVCSRWAIDLFMYALLR